MKIKEGYLLRELAGEIIVVPTGQTALNFNGIITLNETSAFLWKVLQQETTETELINALMNEYEVAEETARLDVHTFITSLKAENILR